MPLKERVLVSSVAEQPAPWHGSVSTPPTVSRPIAAVAMPSAVARRERFPVARYNWASPPRITPWL